MAIFKETTCDRFVAYFDVMGFKNRIFRDNHDDVLAMMQKLQVSISGIKEIGEASLEYKKTGKSDRFGKIAKDSISPEILKMFASSLRILPVFFSDSILLVSEDDSDENIFGIIILSSFLFASSLIDQIPMKGAIAYGRQTADFDNSLYFGRPLVDAYVLQEEMCLYGAALHDTMESYLKTKKGVIDTLIKSNLLHWYKTPLKQCKVNHYCLNWKPILVSLNEGKPEEVVSRLYDTVSGSTRCYVDNTLDFVNGIETNKPKK